MCNNITWKLSYQEISMIIQHTKLSQYSSINVPFLKQEKLV